MLVVNENGFKETEVGLIPSDWDVAAVEEIAAISGGGTPSTKNPSYWDGDIAWLTPSDVTSHQGLWIDHSTRYVTELGLKESSAKLMPVGTVLMTSRATIGEVVLCAIPMATNQGFINIIVEDSRLHNEFLAYWITWKKDYLKGLGKGTTFLEIAKGVFKKVCITLPPLPEQQRIAAVLNTLQNEIAAQDDIIASAKDFKRSLMQRLFTYGAGSRPAETKMTEIGEIPAHWDVVELSTVIEGAQYGLNERADTSGKYPILRMNNLLNGRVSIADLKFVDLDEETFEKFRLLPGNVLFNRTNSHELVGKTSLFTTGEDFVFASYLIKVVTCAEKLTPAFLNFYLNMEETQARLKMLATRGVSQSNISATKLKSVLIPLPPSTDEQKELTEQLERVDEKIAIEEDRKTAMQDFFKTMLHQLMTGQIRLRE